MSRLHVLHLIDSLGRGGAERHVLQLAREFARQNVRQSVVYLFRDDALRPALEEIGVECIGLGRPHRTFSLVPLYPELTRRVAELRPSVVSTQLINADIVGRMVAAKLRIPVVSTWQNTTYTTHASGASLQVARNGAQMRFLRNVERRTTKFASRFVAVSSAVRASYVEALSVPESATVVIPNAVDTSRFVNTARTAPQASRPIRLVHVGRHVPQKDVGTLLRAIARLPDVALELHLFGAGPQTNALRALSEELGQARRVHFRGSVSDVAPHLAESDIFVFPSLHEGLALALLEAYGARLPVVASNIPMNLEVDPDARASLFVPPGDVDALAGAIRRMAGDAGLRQRLGEAGPTVIDAFRIEHIAPRFLEVLETAAAAPH